MLQSETDELGLCLGWYGQLIIDFRRRSSILQQPARHRVVTAAKNSGLVTAMVLHARKTT